MSDGTVLNLGSGGDTIYTEDLGNGQKMGLSDVAVQLERVPIAWVSFSYTRKLAT